MTELVPLRKNRDFVLLQAGQVLSSIGSESAGIAYPLLVLALTHSPAKAGIVGFARLSPWVFGFLAGAAVDRFPRKRMMIVSDIVRVGAVTSIVVAIALHRLSFAQIAIVAFVEGTMYVFFNVAEIGALRSVVPGRQLPAAAAAEQARYSTVLLVAPPLGGSLFGLGRALPFLTPSVAAVIIGYRMAVTPDRLTGRVNSVARTIALCGMPLGPLAAGLLLGSFSARTTVAIFAGFLLVLCVFASLSTSIRNAPSLDDLDDLPTGASPATGG